MNMDIEAIWGQYLIAEVFCVEHVLLDAQVILSGHFFGEGMHLQPRPPWRLSGERREDQVVLRDKVFRVEADFLATLAVEAVHDDLAGVDKTSGEPERPVEA